LHSFITLPKTDMQNVCEKAICDKEFG